MPITYHKCEFCSFTHRDLAVCIEHEKICYFNPDLKRCGSCVNYGLWSECKLTDKKKAESDSCGSWEDRQKLLKMMLKEG